MASFWLRSSRPVQRACPASHHTRHDECLVVAVLSHARLRERLFVLPMLVSGFCGISYEVLYARIFGNLIGDQFLVSATVLLVFLLGIGLGTLAAHRLARWLWALEAAIGVWGVAFAFGAKPLDSALYAAGAGFAVTIALC